MIIAFDIDHTLILRAYEGRAYHLRAYMEAMEELYGGKAVFDFDARGMTDWTFIAKLMERSGVGGSVERVMKRGLEIYMQNYRDLDVRTAIDGVKEFLDFLKENDYRLYLLTGNAEEVAWTKLERAGLKGYFEGGVFGDFPHSSRVDLGRKFIERFSKPEWYFGDSLRDIETAKSMGTKVACITTAFSREELERAGADFVFSSYRDSELYRLFQ